MKKILLSVVAVLLVVSSQFLRGKIASASEQTERMLMGKR